MKKDKLYILKWEHKKTGETGRGRPVTKQMAEAWKHHANIAYPQIEHWVEEYGQTSHKA